MSPDLVNPFKLLVMSNCPQCAANLPDSSRFCPACGRRLSRPDREGPDLARTLARDPSLATRTTAAGTGAASGGPTAALIPGTMVSDRYRIVGLLGRGGMGEVYRADDLKLDQPVALKFLPAGLEQKPGLLDRFLNEVRTALKVTHPNVCRVYDIGEVDGRHFLSMEYVDGEDLASLLRRIGRLPHERAVEVARQICAGLTAAHKQGILHRDLKPANVMVDGRGQVRLTDFGLAGLIDSIAEDDVSSGTPAYMAPEQLTGQEVSARSDIYSLGLVLYEIFTGRAVFEGKTIAELTRHHTSTLPSHPSQHVADIDPVVETALLRCLEKDPADRPQTVLAVSAALPGGDPLAAALAAGETPSPELVAEAGRRDGMRPGAVLLLATAALLVIVGATRWAGFLTMTNYLPLDKRPEVLMDRAQSILGELGYTEPVYREPVDTAWGLLRWLSIVTEIAASDSSAARWEKLRQRPDAAAFWYRQSPRIIYPAPLRPPVFTRGSVSLTNPLASNAGEAMVLLDLAGNLRRLEVMPKRMSTRKAAEPDWTPLFALAGLDTARFREDRPRYQRFLAPDLRRAWLGTRAEAPDVELRVEAGAFEGRPVLFNVATATGLEDLGADPEPNRWTFAQLMTNALQPMLILAVVLGAITLSRRNLQGGRADRRGAARFAGLGAMLFLVANALRSHVLFTFDWASEIWPLIVGATFMGVVGWSLYSAAEPLGRRLWPTMFVSSSRLLSPPRVQWLDPLTGKSVLIGVLAGGIRFAIAGPVRWLFESWREGMPAQPTGFDIRLLQGQRQALSVILDQSLLLGFVLVHVVALLGILLVVKRRRLALALTLVVWILLSGTDSLTALIYAGLTSIISLVVLLRWGAVALVVSFLTLQLAFDARAADWSAWHGQGPVLALVLLIGLVVYGAWAATGGRRNSA